MNTKSNRTRLIVEFKERQRLPEWPIVKVTDPDRSSENSANQKIALPLVYRGAVFPARGFAE